MQPNSPNNIPPGGDKVASDNGGHELQQINSVQVTPELNNTSYSPQFSKNEGSVEYSQATAPEQTNVPFSTSTSQPVQSESSGAVLPPVVPPTKKSRKKLFIISAIVATVLLTAGVSGAYFGVYVPSKPENVWSRSLTNSGKLYDAAVAYSTSAQTPKAMKLEGSYDVNGAIESDGKVSGELKGLDSSLSGELSAAGTKLGFDVRTIKATETAPDLYFKLTGLQGIGDLLGGGPELASALNGLNNQWYFIDHTLFEQASSTSGQSVSEADIKAAVDKIGVPTKEYLFASDETKAVFKVTEFIGNEVKDGRKMYHYKVGVDSSNLGKYVEAVCSALKDDKLAKDYIARNGKDCAELGRDAASSKIEDTADVWVDKRTKLPHVVRIGDKKNADNWLEIGQDYQGGDTFPFSFKFQSKQDGMNLTAALNASLNIKTNQTSVTGTLGSSGGKDDNFESKFSLKLTPKDGDSVKVEKPTDAKSVIELMNELGLNELLGGGSGASFDTLESTVLGINSDDTL